jgi:flagellar hook-associated protein 2
MAGIQATNGLISGIPIQDTVDKLMALSARPRDLLKQRNDALQQEQTALSELMGLLYSVNYITTNLGKEDLYAKQIATSSDPAALAATVTGAAANGVYQLTPLRQAQNQQFLGSGLASNTAALGGGAFSFRFGDSLLRTANLQWLGGGAGVARGSIRITDRSGAQAVVDLTAAQNVQDVLDAINNTTTINVTATVQGDRIRLTDNTGDTAGNLRVQDIGSGQTAAGLGLAGINVAAAMADGQDVLGLHDGLDVAALNDGRGVRANTVLPDIEYTLRDGTTGTIDLSPIVSGGSTVDREKTLGDIVARVNAANPGKLKLEIAADGKRLVATDLTAGTGAFAITALHDSKALADLGLDGAATGGVITGRRLLAGLQGVLLSGLNGGKGFGALGGLTLTDRSGATATVDLSQAETLSDAIDAINASGLGIVAGINAARNGIALTDTTGLQQSNLIVANADGTNTADKLHMAANSAAKTVNSGDLHLQVVGENTRLAALNGGRGVTKGSLVIQDSRGAKATLNLQGDAIQTVGDVLAAINRSSLGLRAEINDAGDGIRLVDTARGGGTLKVDGGVTARDLHLDAAVATVQIDGQSTQVVDGTTTYKIQLGATETLTDLRAKINALGGGATAAVVSDGSSKPFRLSLTSDRPGSAGQLVVDSTLAGLSLEETARGQDALLLLGNPANPAAGVLVSSPTNSFSNVLSGVSLEIKQATGKSVTVLVNNTSADVVANVKTLVENYNKFRSRFEEQTAYDAAANKRAILTGDSAALRLDMDLPSLLSGRFVTGGAVKSLVQIGVKLKDDGTLEFDETKFKDAYAADPDGVKKLFTAADTGLSARFGKLVEQLAGEKNSVLTGRLNAIEAKVQANNDRITLLTVRLNAERERLLLSFYNMEAAIAKIQDSLSVISQIQPLTITTTKK